MEEIVTYYATANRRAPWVAVHGQWPPRAGLTRSCMAGVRILRRPMTEAEVECHRDPESRRFHADRWPSLIAMLRAHRDYEFGDDEFPRKLLAAVRENQEEIRQVIEGGRSKARKHAARLAKLREQ